MRLVLGMNVAGRCSARSIPLSSSSSGLQAGYCAPSLSDSSGFCCTQSDLTAWENQFGYYPSGIALRGSTCRRAWRKVNCAIACDASSLGWWDASISRAHLCTNVCQDLWQCYTPGFTTTQGVIFDSMTSFCNYHSGPKRPDLNACLGYYAGEETSSTANFLTIGVGFLLGPPSPPRPPSPPSPPPLGEDKSSGAAGAGVGVACGILLLCCLCCYRSWLKRRLRQEERFLQALGVGGTAMYPAPTVRQVEQPGMSLYEQQRLRQQQFQVQNEVAAIEERQRELKEKQRQLRQQQQQQQQQYTGGAPDASYVRRDRVAEMRAQVAAELAAEQAAAARAHGPVPVAIAVPVAAHVAARTPEERRRARLHAQLDAQLEAQAKADRSVPNMAAQLGARMAPDTRGAVLGGTSRVRTSYAMDDDSDEEGPTQRDGPRVAPSTAPNHAAWNATSGWSSGPRGPNGQSEHEPPQILDPDCMLIAC